MSDSKATKRESDEVPSLLGSIMLLSLVPVVVLWESIVVYALWALHAWRITSFAPSFAQIAVVIFLITAIRLRYFSAGKNEGPPDVGKAMIMAFALPLLLLWAGWVLDSALSLFARISISQP